MDRFLITTGASSSEERQAVAAKTSGQILELLEQNTKLTTIIQQLSQRIEKLTDEMHQTIVRP